MWPLGRLDDLCVCVRKPKRNGASAPVLTASPRLRPDCSRRRELAQAPVFVPERRALTSGSPLMINNSSAAPALWTSICPSQRSSQRGQQ
ncbi:hypothetical protein AAHC03_04567 [Spirometra sp. Aus1]